METNTVKLYTLPYDNLRTYLVAAAFIMGNIIFPQACHLIPQGGLILLPIYFFTLVGAYKYGWKVGLLTALLSPVINHLLFGMPALGVLPAILLKSTLLALAAAWAARKFERVSILILTGVVVAYQTIGLLGEWAITGSFAAATQDFRLALPGMLLQILGGYLVIKYLLKK